MSQAYENGDEPCGFLNIHKPAGCTSRDVVNQVQRITGVRRGKRRSRIGHAGTLDPMATGVLVVCIGRATKLVPVLHELSKTYIAGFTLGQTSNTDDSTGEVQKTDDCPEPTRSELESALQRQLGVVMQVPPAFSAVKIDGVRSYKAARAGEQVTITSRPVTIHSIRLLDYDFPRLRLEIECGSGTYIRSIARDLGTELKTGGLMHELERTRIGPFRVEAAKKTTELDHESRFDWRDHLVPAEMLFEDRPKLILDDARTILLRDGKPVEQDSTHEELIAVTDQGKFAAILHRKNHPGDDDQSEAGGRSKYRASINWVPGWFDKQ